MKIMAPAGDSDRLSAAIKAGADEVYMGISGFGARRFARNFSVDEYCSALDLAHRSNVAVHLTFNTILSDAEMELVRPDLKRLYEYGLDAAIVQDFGAAAWLKENFPELKLCASTQLSPATAAEVEWYGRQGFSRVVLARELSLDEIRAIRRQSDVELEVFVSGALCLGCSGKCYLSSFIGGRSGNRGMCAQPCRQYYRAERFEGDRAVSDGAYGYFLSLKDQLQGRDELSALIDVGVESVKVEGRMKSPSYVYETVRYYRDLIDSITGVSPVVSARRLSVRTPASVAGKGSSGAGARSTPDVESEETRRENVAALFNRGYDHGYFYEHDPAIINEYYSSNFGVEIGRVRRDAVRLSHAIRNGDGVVFLDETARKLGGLYVSGIRLVDPTNSRRSRIVDSAEPGDIVQFHEPVPENAAFLYRTFNYRLNKETDAALQHTRRREPVNARLVARVGRPLELTLTASRASATVTAEQNVEPAQKKGLDRESLLESLDRFGETPFWLDKTRLDFDTNAFVPKSLLNQLRQTAVDRLVEALLNSYRRPGALEIASPAVPETVSVDVLPNVQASVFHDATPLATGAPVALESTLPYLAASVRTKEQYDACRAAGIKRIYPEVRPVRFEGRAALRTSPLFAPMAGSPDDALHYEREGVRYALSWFFNAANAKSVRRLAELLPNVNVMYLSPEISDHAIDALFENLGDYQDERRLTLGLPVYGRLLAMYTQKTLFDQPLMRLTNADDRRFFVERNSERLKDFPEAFADDAPETTSGSSVYLEEPLDLVDAIPWILGSGVGEVLLTFTGESAAEVRRVIARATSSVASDKYKTFSYGYTRDGVF